LFEKNVKRLALFLRSHNFISIEHNSDGITPARRDRLLNEWHVALLQLQAYNDVVRSLASGLTTWPSPLCGSIGREREAGGRVRERACVRTYVSE
jgi:hypothetical protein